MGFFDPSRGQGSGPAAMPDGTAPHDDAARRNELIFQCILSDQVPESELGALMEDAAFRAYFEQRIRAVRKEDGLPPHAAGLLSGLTVWLQGWRRGAGADRG